MDAFDNTPTMKSWELLELVEKLKDSGPRITDTELDYLKSLDNYDSIHIEGNSLTRAEVTSFLENGLTVHGKPFKDFMECKNYGKALDLLVINMNEDFTLTTMFIRSLHKLLMSNVIDDEYTGSYRKEQEGVRGSTHLPPWWTEIPDLMQKVVGIYNEWDGEEETRFENIIRTMYQFERIHPFIDGNGRTSRILMNYLLLANGYSFMWINAEYRAEYLESFASWKSCLEFHANRMLTMYKMFRDIRTGKLDSVETI